LLVKLTAFIPDSSAVHPILYDADVPAVPGGHV